MSRTGTFQFRPPYTLSGESGMAVGPLRQSFASLGITSPLLDLRSMAADTLRISQEGGTSPEYMQPVSLWDNDGRRVFTGLVTDSDEQWNGKKTRALTTISGPWWWLDQVQLTSIIADDTGGSQERAIYTFPSQDLAISIRSLLDRLQEMGVPIRCGDIDATFQVPQMQFQNGTAESILTTMLQGIPDCATSVRYDADGLPYLDVLRRPTAPKVTIDLAAADNKAGIPRLTEQRSLVPTQVRVQTMEVNSTGAIVYGEDVAGDPSPPTPLGRQILALSGPGRGDFNSYTPRVATLQTETVLNDRGFVWALARVLDPVILEAEAENANIPWVTFADYGFLPQYSRNLSGTGTYRLISGTVFEWVTTEFGVTEGQARISGWLIGTYNQTLDLSGMAYLGELSRCGYGFSGGHYQCLLFVDFTVPVISASYPSLTVLVHPDDRALVTPVPGLASNLFAAQNYIPISGNVPLFPGSPMPLPGSRLNIRGGLPKWATMGAMTSGLSLDLRTGSAEAQVGRASRIATSSLLNQFSRPLSGKIIKA